MENSLSEVSTWTSLFKLGSQGPTATTPQIRSRRLLRQIASLEDETLKLNEQDLRRKSLSLRYRARSGEPLVQLLPEAFALVRVAAIRALGMRHYDVQILGGIAVCGGSQQQGAIVEMQTGEGKTLTATLPMYLNALPGHGAHLATANDYLASRDAELMRNVYELLGMSVGILQSETPPPQRRKAYQCDITYSSAKEFGFDFLRDRLLLRAVGGEHHDLLGGMLGYQNDEANKPVQRDLHFMLVDEADSILIDEARTPLIVSSLPGNSQETAEAIVRWAAKIDEKFAETEHYRYDQKRRQATLNAAGRQLLRQTPAPPILNEFDMLDMYEHVERAIKVRREYIRDRHYVIRDGEILIIDEFTGRPAEGRKWQDGIHQGIEAKEDIKISVKTDQAARITVQDFFLQYDRLAGMTGTAFTSRRELKRIYSLPVVVAATNNPPQRKQLPDIVLGTSQEKWQAIREEVRQIHAAGRPVLIGTRSIDKSEILSALLREAGLPHQVLNARQIAAEAEIISQAGNKGRITVATNMAGRGTDIQLDESVIELGGLHVICSELHESARIDRQLIGRCGRQGDPGTYRQYMALEDEILMAGLGHRRAKRLKSLGATGKGPFNHLAPLFRRAQARVEREHFRQRRILMYHEKDRRKTQLEMGQDPHLDSAI